MAKRAFNDKFSLGDRVIHSAHGVQRLKPHRPERVGTVIGFSCGSGFAVRVHWDGTGSKTTDVLHQDYLQLAQETVCQA